VAAPALLDSLSRSERLQLLRFVVSFAWADLSVGPAERAFVEGLLSRLALEAEERVQVAAWLLLPPPPEEVDPNAVPREHRELFVQAAREIIRADGYVTAEERENLALLDQLTR
jgi:uncharacterized membrane protein YebE (DUF533 family)